MEIIDEKVLWEGNFIKTLLIRYRDRAGAVRGWEAVGRVGSSGVVVVVPLTAENELLLIRQFRPVVGRYVVELPAGLVAEGEDAFSTARRELIEETGHSSNDFRELAEGVMSMGINTEVWKVLLALGARQAPPEVLRSHLPDENEDIEVVKAPIGALDDVMEKRRRLGDYVDLRILGLVELAKRRLGLR